ncbi:dihydromonapterin reductase [Kistimonas asteriae]|uniref:dihydromonapterin reductase n=1 Tax=Kistimonas asteriae TaxID=517724 RepID=UPI001BAB9503|nr:dihydromonapterin reductase [Kistimonas asteriae]
MAETSCSPILITGGGRRLGLYNARALKRDDHPVIITYRTENDELEALQREGIHTIKADFSSNENILAFIGRIQQETDSLRAIIHNASEFTPDVDSPLDTDTLASLFQVHMMAPWLINRGLRPLLENCDSGTADIIHMTDHNTRHGSATHAAYSATKAGLENMTASMARLFAPTIKVNAIAPYLIIMNEQDREAEKAGRLQTPPMGLAPGEQVIYQTVRFLLDNPYITGATIPVDGGMSLTQLPLPTTYNHMDSE